MGHRLHITQLRQYLLGIGESLLIAASKFFAGETMALEAANRWRFVVLMPQTVGLRQELGMPRNSKRCLCCGSS